VLLLLLLVFAALFLRAHRAPVTALTYPDVREPVLSERASDTGAGEQVAEQNVGVPQLSANKAPTAQRSHAEIMADMRAADRLPAEERLLDGKAVYLNGITAVVMAEGEQFAQMLDDMQRQMMADPLASEVDHMYRSGIEQAMHDNPSAGEGTPKLERLVCGLRICAGAFGGVPDGVDPDDWWNDFVINQSGLPTYVSALVPATDSNGTLQYRFVFSTDPSSSSISGKASPAPLDPDP
jgi:hypothetical protein